MATSTDDKIRQFFQDSVGIWNSDRVLTDLKTDRTKRISSEIKIEFLDYKNPLLLQLERDSTYPQHFLFGANVSWKAFDIDGEAKSDDSVVMGIHGNSMVRSRSFFGKTPHNYLIDYCDDALVVDCKIGNDNYLETIRLVGDRARMRNMRSNHLLSVSIEMRR